MDQLLTYKKNCLPSGNEFVLSETVLVLTIMVPVLTEMGIILLTYNASCSSKNGPILTLMVPVWTGMGVILSVMVPILPEIGLALTLMVSV